MQQGTAHCLVAHYSDLVIKMFCDGLGCFGSSVSIFIYGLIMFMINLWMLWLEHEKQITLVVNIYYKYNTNDHPSSR